MDSIAFVDDLARLDVDRQQRSGVPEVVLGQGKTLEQILAISAKLAEARGTAIVSRLDPDTLKRMRERLEPQLSVEANVAGRLAVVRKKGDTPGDVVSPDTTGGVVGLVAAGTADIPVAEEARVIAREMGCEVVHHYDIGVAGLHRLVEPMKDLLRRDVAAVVAVAGMEGALPTLVKGLVPVPVIGVPTSVGYGLGRPGEAALLTMLSSCTLGLTVVNIDNGLGAGAAAALIANRLAATRSTGDGGGAGSNALAATGRAGE